MTTTEWKEACNQDKFEFLRACGEGVERRLDALEAAAWRTSARVESPVVELPQE